jgi:CDP-glucose 4,6-dehydratase
MGDCIAVSDIVGKIQRILRMEHIEPIKEISRRPEIVHQQLSAEKARRDLGWEPIYPIDKGLVETVTWFTDFLSANSRSQSA